MSGAVVVVPSAGHTMEQECDALTPLLSPGHSDPRWEVTFSSEDGTEAFIDPNSSAFYSTLSWRRTPSGFDVLDLRISANALTHEASVDTASEYLWAALVKLNAAYGFLTDMDFEMTSEWVDGTILKSLRTRSFQELAEPTFRMLLLSRELLDEMDVNGDWVSVREGAEGQLLAR